MIGSNKTYIVTKTSSVSGKHRHKKDSSSKLSTSSSISTKAIHQLVDKLKREHNRDSTKQNYYNIWRIFNAFFIQLDVKPKTWEERLILFVGHCVQMKKRSSTIKSYISAIKELLRDDGVEINEDSYLLASLIRASRLINKKVQMRLPIRKSMMCVIVHQVGKMYMALSQPYLAVLYQAIFSTAYFGLFRVGELVEGSHPVKVNDVHLAKNKKKLLFVLRTSKNHGINTKPQTVKITSVPCTKSTKKHNEVDQVLRVCPYQLLRNYIAIRRPYKKEDKPFFVFNDRSSITPDQVRAVLKKVLLQANFNPHIYGMHGFRSGKAIDIMEVYGLSVEMIRKIGRSWSVSMHIYPDPHRH